MEGVGDGALLQLQLFHAGVPLNADVSPTLGLSTLYKDTALAFVELRAESRYGRQKA